MTTVIKGYKVVLRIKLLTYFLKNPKKMNTWIII